MCLYKVHRFPKISTKPIKCYKLVFRNNKDEYETSVTEYKFRLGDTIKSKSNWILGIFRRYLNSEVVHSYICNFYTIEEMKEFNRWYISRRYIECEIPPFTPYWIGFAGEIGAARIRTIKEV